MNNKPALPIDDNLESILICAARYAIGRRTYMPCLVCNYIQPLVPHLSNKALHVMIRDIGARGDDLGDPNINAPHWRNLLKTLKIERQRRPDNGAFSNA